MKFLTKLSRGFYVLSCFFFFYLFRRFFMRNTCISWWYSQFLTGKSYIQLIVDRFILSNLCCFVDRFEFTHNLFFILHVFAFCLLFKLFSFLSNKHIKTLLVQIYDEFFVFFFLHSIHCTFFACKIFKLNWQCQDKKSVFVISFVSSLSCIFFFFSLLLHLQIER